MKVQVEIVDNAVSSRNITTKNNQPMTLHSQAAYLHRSGEKYPLPFQLQLDSGNGYQAGMYTLSPESLFVGQFNKLECRPKLVPVQAKA